MLEYGPEGLLLGNRAVHEGISAIIPHEKGAGIPLEPRPLIERSSAHVVALNAVVVGFVLPVRRESGCTAKDNAAIDSRIRPIETPEFDGISRRIVNDKSIVGCVDGHNRYTRSLGSRFNILRLVAAGAGTHDQDGRQAGKQKRVFYHTMSKKSDVHNKHSLPFDRAIKNILDRTIGDI